MGYQARDRDGSASLLMTAPATSPIPSTWKRWPPREGDLPARARAVYLVHKLALQLLALIVLFLWSAHHEQTGGAQIAKFLFLNGLGVLARHYDIAYPGLEEGVHLGYLMRGIHDLALGVLGQWDALAGGLFCTYWSLTVIRVL